MVKHPKPRLPDPEPTVSNIPPPVAGRGAGYARYKASPAYDAMVEKTRAEQRAALTPRKE
jgi:hypothetical protein